MKNFFETISHVEDILHSLEDLLIVDRYRLPCELLFELQSLRTYICCWLHRNDQSFGMIKNLEPPHLLLGIKDALTRFIVQDPEVSFQPHRSLSEEILPLLQQLKPKIKEDCLNLLSCFQPKFDNDMLGPFVKGTTATLGSLLEDGRADHHEAILVESLKNNLDLFAEVFEFALKSDYHYEEFRKFKDCFQDLAWRTACLALWYWIQLQEDVEKENTRSRTKVIDLLLKDSSPFTPEVMMMYLAVLTISKPPLEIKLTTGKVVHKFVEFFKDNMQVDPEQHAIQMLFIDLIFFITFLIDWREVKKLPEGESILIQVVGLVIEALPVISSLGFGEPSFLLHNLLENAKALKVEVRRICVPLFPNSLSFNFSNINVSRRIDLLLEILKKGSSFHFAKHLIRTLQEELCSLKKSNFEDFSILELQNKHTEIKYLWTRIVNVAYLAERAANSFVYMKFLWHDVLHLFEVIEEFNFIKGEMKRIRDHHMCDNRALNSEKNLNALIPLHTNIAIADEVVGLKNEKKIILDRLIGGPKELDIVSIVGMAGLGKTTLAKKVYASVEHHFHRHAWCTISQTFHNKRLFLDILRGICVFDDDDDDLSNKKEEDLAQILYKSLKGQRYLVVMDDIWDVEAWNVLKMSFPDDNLGSRIMFTSRIRELVSEAKPGCVPVPLEPLSDKESWELLEKKLFDQDRCPVDFFDIGMQIAAKCKGLPLSVVLVAGILMKNAENPDWWSQVGERLDILVSNEDCMNILELSYKHLPEFLKPCFLYFGLFPEDEEIRVKKLMLLWISEGFIQKHESKSLEVMAYEYLNDLVGRSLVNATQRSSTDRIKRCSVHDLLHEFCLMKGEEENIFKVFHGNEVSYNSHYRVCIQDNDDWSSFLEHGSSAPFVHSLLPINKDSRPLEIIGPKQIGCLASHFRFLQVLVLRRSVCIYHFPETITDLVLLKCLMITHELSRIPPSITKLQSLETLVLKCHSFFLQCYIPLMGIMGMQKLRHLIARGAYTTSYSDMPPPPSETVRSFLCAHLRLPYEMLDSLLRKIPDVENFKCQIENSDDLYTKSNLILKFDFLSHLESLTVYYRTHHTQARRSSFELNFPSCLKKLHLVDFTLPWSSLSVISKLPKLEVLKLNGGISGKTWFVVDEEFQNLKFLRIKRLEIEELNASDNSFPRLERFEVEWCKYLKEIPCTFRDIPTLKVIQVGFYLESSAKQIQDEQKDLGNELLQVLKSPL